MATGGTQWGPLRIAWADVPAAADRFSCGRMLMARLVAQLTGVERASIVRGCDHCGSSDHGRPRVQGAEAVVSVSYAGTLVVAVAAASVEAVAIGVDVEVGEGECRLADLSALFAPAPPPTLREWTLLEAAAKADGRGLRLDVGEVRWQARKRGTAVLLPGRAQPVEATAVAGPPGYVISAALVARAGSAG